MHATGSCGGVPGPVILSSAAAMLSLFPGLVDLIDDLGNTGVVQGQGIKVAISQGCHSQAHLFMHWLKNVFTAE